MTKLSEVFPHLVTMTPAQLHNRRAEIAKDAGGVYKKISTEGLRELAFIYSLLRTAGTKSTRASKAAATNAMDLI